MVLIIEFHFELMSMLELMPMKILLSREFDLSLATKHASSLVPRFHLASRRTIDKERPGLTRS